MTRFVNAMSAEKLKALVEQGNLINLNIVSDSLATLLHEVGTMLADQQQQIAQLRKELSERLPAADFYAFKETWNTDCEKMMQAIPTLEASMQRLNREMDERNAALRGEIEQAVNSVLMSVDNRIAQKMDAVSADQAVVRQSVNALEHKVKELSEASGSAGKCDEAVLSRIQLLENKVAELARRSDEHASIASANATATATACDKSEFDAFKDELRKEVQQLKDSLEEYKAAVPAQPSTSTSSIANAGMAEVKPHVELAVPDHTGIPGYNMSSGVKLDGPAAFMSPVPPQMPSGISDPIDTIEDDEVEMNEMDELRQGLAQMEEALEEMNKSLVSRIERKSEINLVERMFEKLRVIIASVRDDITAIQAKMPELVTRAEMEEYVQGLFSAYFDEDLASASNRPYKCLSCGRPRVRQSQAETYVLSPSRTSTNELPSLHPRTKI